MSNQDTTDWFPPHINPVRVGYYQRNYGYSIWLNKVPDYWDGQSWFLCDETGARYCPAGYLRPWRGLRRPPA